MFEKFKNHYGRWTRWKKRNLNGPVYKCLVLFGVVHSPTFEMMSRIEDWERENKTDGELKGYKDDFEGD